LAVLNLAHHLHAGPQAADEVLRRDRDLPGFFAELRQRPETAARALELLLLTCCPRTGEVIPATWGEIDGDRWNVPAAHMKSGIARTIPLSAAAIALLDSIRPAEITPDTLIFGSRRRGGSGRQTDDAMQTLIREKMGLGYTVHGFRSSFMDWVGCGGSPSPPSGGRTGAGPQDGQPGSAGLSENRLLRSAPGTC
jgi:integrase